MSFTISELTKVNTHLGYGYVLDSKGRKNFVKYRPSTRRYHHVLTSSVPASVLSALGYSSSAGKHYPASHLTWHDAKHGYGYRTSSDGKRIWYLRSGGVWFPSAAAYVPLAWRRAAPGGAPSKPRAKKRSASKPKPKRAASRPRKAKGVITTSQLLKKGSFIYLSASETYMMRRRNNLNKFYKRQGYMQDLWKAVSKKNVPLRNQKEAARAFKRKYGRAGGSDFA